MKMKSFGIHVLIAVTLCWSGCKDKASLIPPIMPSAFTAYWFDGNAEISSYALTQSLYGSKYEGRTVLLFVTEDFNKREFIRIEPSAMKNADAVTVMRLNSMTEFNTGIADNAKMTSVYTPIDRKVYPQSLMLTFSQHDWNGQTFMEARWKGNRYDVHELSYLVPGNKEKQTLARAALEEEIWTLIRIAPNLLPVGKVNFIASPAYLQSNKLENKVYEAVTTLTSSCDYYNYTIQYPALDRILDIEFEAKFPYKIISWSERVGNIEVSAGRILNTVKSDYWNRHGRIDEVLRKDLKLDE
jgi:hypothetical protein